MPSVFKKKLHHIISKCRHPEFKTKLISYKKKIIKWTKVLCLAINKDFRQKSHKKSSDCSSTRLYISFNYTQKFPIRTKFRNAHSKLRHSTVKYFFEINKRMAEIDFICKL